MKKIFNFILIIMFLFPVIVNAELRTIELEKQFNTGVRSPYYTPIIEKIDEDNYFIYGNLVPDKDDFSEGYAIYDRNGNLIKTQDLDYNVDTVLVEGNNTYIVNNGTIYLLDNLSGKIIKEFETNIDENVYYMTEEGIYIQSYISSTKTYHHYIINKELTTITEIEEAPERIKKHNIDSVTDEIKQKFYDFLIEKHNITEEDYIVDYVIESKNQYYSVIKKEGNKYSIAYVDKEFSKADFIPIINNEINQTIQDRYAEGNIILELYSIDNGVIAFVGNDLIGCPIAMVEYQACGMNTIMQIYKEKYLIKTKTDNNGSITTKTIQADRGEKVEFSITPKEGYVLGEVKVIDIDGNIITFNDYTFTMPSNDVTIEVSFIKSEKNPDTSDKLILTFLILFLIIFAFNIFSKKQIKEFA